MTPAQNLPSWRSRIGILAVTSITVLALAGCSGTEASGAPTSEISSTPNAEPTPMFASDDEALAAAELAYRNYIAVSDEIARDGGAGFERLRPFVSPELFERSRGDFDYYSAGNLHGQGMTGMDSFRIQSFLNQAQGSDIEAYLCLRLVGARILDESERDVTPEGRENNLPLVVRLSAISSEKGFVVSAGEVWQGTNFC